MTGAGTYLDDLRPPGLCHLVFVRGYLPHASIGAIELADARSAAGVIAVVTAAELKEAPTFPVSGPKGSRLPQRPLLNDYQVRFSGDLIGFIVAETREQARDAADRVVVELDARPVVTDPLAAADVGAPLVHDSRGTNIADESTPIRGDAEAAVTVRIPGHRGASPVGVGLARLPRRLLSGGYRLAALQVDIRSGYTDKTPIPAYRGGGRPEAIFLLERMSDVAAREVRIDAADM